MAAVGALAGLGGCGRVVRPNDVPGGVQFVNRRDTRESVTLRAFRLFAGTPGEETPTPVEREPVAAGRFPVPAGATATNDDFFPAAGRYVVAASNRGATARGRIELFETLSVLRLTPR